MTDMNGNSDSTDVTSIYLAGSINDSDDHGEQWRCSIQNVPLYEEIGVNFLNPLDEHHPEDGDVSGIVEDDLDLLERADGILLKYDGDKQCWGTPSEQGYALAHNQLMEQGVLSEDYRLPVVVWRTDGVEEDVSLTENRSDSVLSPWLVDDRTAIGVHVDRDIALSYLLDELDHEPLPFETSTREDVDLGVNEVDPLTDVIDFFAREGFDQYVSYPSIVQNVDHDVFSIGQILTLLQTVDVLERYESGGTEHYLMENSAKSRSLVREFTRMDFCDGIFINQLLSQTTVADD